MRKKTIIRFFVFAILIFQYGCSEKWTNAIQLGSIYLSEFNETVSVEVRNGLIIMPVKIGGETYRFLFDSGAPFSISEKLQNSFEYKIISNGYIVDSDNNREKVNYVQVDTQVIGSTPFISQTAFVANFESNPILECLDIDGIIGSNLMRHCNWTIDYQNKEITLFSAIEKSTTEGAVTIPFHTDQQYNILVDFSIGNSGIKNMTIDYGFNGTISLPNKIFDTLKQNEIIGDTFIEEGVKESGLVGEPINFRREISYVDEITFGDITIDDVEISSGNSGLIGKKILSGYTVTIDWQNRSLHLKELEQKELGNKTFGIRIGASANNELYVQSVIENSSAHKNGIIPNMEVLKIDGLDFLNSHNFCDYVMYMDSNPENMSIELRTINGLTKLVYLEQTRLKKF